MSNVTQSRRKVAPDVEQRKRRFAAALSLAGMDREGFAKRYDVNPTHLSKALNGHRPLAGKTRDAVDAFIAKYLPERAA